MCIRDRYSDDVMEMNMQMCSMQYNHSTVLCIYSNKVCNVYMNNVSIITILLNEVNMHNSASVYIIMCIETQRLRSFGQVGVPCTYPKSQP